MNGTTGLYYWYDAPTRGDYLGQSGSSYQTSYLSDTDTLYVSEYDTTASQDALHFDGSDDYVAIQDFTYSGGGYTEMTVEAWVKTSDASGQVIASYDRSEFWRLEINGTGAGAGRVAFDVMTDAGQLDFGSNARIDDGSWHHVAAVFDNGDVSLYIDGVLDNSTSMGATFGTGTTRYGFLGTGSEASSFNGSKGPNNYFNGNMDEVRVWSAARTQSQIQANMNSCLNGLEAGLEIYYRMDGSGSVSTVQDHTGNDYNGELNNILLPGAWLASSPDIYHCHTCESTRDTVIAGIDQKPSPNLGSDTCISGTSLTIDAGVGYSSYTWQDASTGQTFTANAAGTYHVTVDSAGLVCSGSDTIDVLMPTKPTGQDTSVCGSGEYQLQVTGGTGNYKWYDQPTGGTAFQTDTGSFTTPFVNTTDTFYVASYDTMSNEGALSFDGNDDYIAIQDYNYNSSSNTEVTVEAWVRTNDGSDQVIASFDRSEYWRLEVNGSGAGTGQIGFDVMTDAGQLDFGSNARIDDGNWHHVAAVYDNGDVDIYIDGVLDNSTSLGSTFGSTETRYGFLGLGSEASSFNGSTGPDNYFNGDLDEVRVWDVAKTQADIQNSMNQCLLGNENGLVLNYAMEDESGSMAADKSVNGNDGSLKNMSTPSAWIEDGTVMYGCPGSCESPRDTVVLTVNPEPVDMLGNDVCASSSVTLDAGAGYSSYLWNTGETTQSIVADTSGFYSVQVDSNGTPCTGTDGVTVSILSQPSANDTSRCGSGKMDLTASGSTGDYFWYDTPAGDTLLGSGATYTTPFLSETDTFYVAAFGSDTSTEAMTFDGTDDVVALDKFYNGAGQVSQLTLEAWVKTSISGEGVNDNWSIIDFDRSEYFNLYVTGDDGRVGFSTTDNSSTIDDFYSNTTVNDGQWHHIVAVYNGTDKIIYIDGVQDATKSNAHGGAPLGTGVTRYGFIGDGSEASTFNGNRNGLHFNGEIDEVRIWDDVRNLLEIQNNKDVCLSGTESNLAAYYKMEDGSGSNNLTDHSTSNHTGTLQNMDVNNSWINTGQPINCSCGESPMDTVEVEIKAEPSINLGEDTCVLSSSLELDAGSGYSSYLWKDGSTGQTLNATTSQAYWVEVDSAGTTCSGTDTIVVNVGSAAKPTLQSTSACGSNTADLIASSSGTVKWWDQATGGTLLGKGDTLTVGPLSSDSVFYASASLASKDALSFDGTDDYAAIKNKNYNSTGNTAVTVEAWVKTSNGSDQIIASYDRSEYWRLEVNGEGAGKGKVGFDVMTDAGQLDFGSSNRIDDGSWHHVAGVYDNGNAYIYIDGTLDNSASMGSTFGTGTTRYGFIGEGSEASSFDGPRNDRYFDGTVDEVRVWSTARSQAQITTYKDSCLDGNETDLDLYYRLDEGSGTSITDYAGSNDGTINGASWNTNGKPFQCSPCSESDRVSVMASVVQDIDSVTYEVSYPGENGSTAFLEAYGGSGKYDCREISGIFNYDGSYDTGTIKKTLPNGGTFNIEVKDEKGCKDTAQYVNTAPSPSVTGIPSSDASSTSRKIPAKDEWYYVTSSSNEGIVAINPKNNDLGKVDASIYKDASATVYQDQAFMQRHYVIEPEHQPSSDVEVRAYFKNAELTDLSNTIANKPSVTDGILSTKDELSITKYQGPTEDGTYNPSDATSLKSIEQDTSNSQFGANYIQFTTSGFSEVWMNSDSTDGGTAQPIELMHFDAQYKDTQVILKWATQTEINNDFFTVERARDGRNFEKVTTVEGAGNSSNTLTYKAFDQNPYDGVSYYRLKQTDFNGEYSYSDIVMVENNGTQAQKMTIDVYPNPTRGKFHLNLNGFEQDQQVKVTVRSMKGQTFATKRLKTTEEDDRVTFNNAAQNLSPGIYLVTCVTKNSKITEKLVIE